MSWLATTLTSDRLRLALFVLAGLAVGAAAAVAVLPQVRERVLPAVNMPSVGQALVGGPFSLTDHTGRRVTDKDFRGRFMLVFFGFTFCPDVCPTGLQVIAAAIDKLGAKADRLVPCSSPSIPNVIRLRN
jgi:protein SCO1/2